MLHHLPQPDMVGNTHHDFFQGWTFPVPDDDILSCEGQDSPTTQHSIEDVSGFEAAPQSLAEPLQPQMGLPCCHRLSTAAGDNYSALCKGTCTTYS